MWFVGRLPRLTHEETCTCSIDEESSIFSTSYFIFYLTILLHSFRHRKLQMSIIFQDFHSSSDHSQLHCRPSNSIQTDNRVRSCTIRCTSSNIVCRLDHGQEAGIFSETFLTFGHSIVLRKKRYANKATRNRIGLMNHMHPSVLLFPASRKL